MALRNGTGVRGSKSRAGVWQQVPGGCMAASPGRDRPGAQAQPEAAALRGGLRMRLGRRGGPNRDLPQNTRHLAKQPRAASSIEYTAL